MNVLGVFAHPDDEVLGAGGTLAKHAAAGDSVFIHVLGRPEVSMSDAAKELGATRWRHHVYADQRFDRYPVAEIAQAVVDWKTDPDVVYTHHPGDLNQDHAITAKAVLTAFRPKPGEKPRTILACEVLSSTEWTFPQAFQPNWFERIDIIHLNKKQAALDCYPSEKKNEPHPRSTGGIANLARIRGQQCGVNYAEAFQLLRRGPM